MPFDNLKPQTPRTRANSRDPAAAIRYAGEALVRSRIAALRCRTALDVAYGADEDQALDIYLPPGADAAGVPVLLYFHGGAWRHGYKEWNGFMAPAFVDLPAIFISVGYRLAPEHRFPAQLDDGLAALAWVHRTVADHGGDPARISVAGWSAGGALGALLALRRETYAAHGAAGRRRQGLPRLERIIRDQARRSGAGQRWPDLRRLFPRQARGRPGGKPGPSRCRQSHTVFHLPRIARLRPRHANQRRDDHRLAPRGLLCRPSHLRRPRPLRQ